MCLGRLSSFECLGLQTLERSASTDLVLSMVCWLGTFLAPDQSYVVITFTFFRYQSRFICDTRGAGAGQLTVRIRGPKGAFRVEMQRESQKDRTILCKYEPTEPGDYRIEVT